MERDYSSSVTKPTDLNFNSHAHVERDITPPFLMLNDKISTHTLTWSVTLPNHFAPNEHAISTHTLTWSVTPPQPAAFGILWISTHTLTWSVTQFSQTSEGLRLISTHTLTWSVT